LFGAITTNGDLVSKNIEHNKNAHKAAIKEAESLLNKLVENYTNAYRHENKNGETSHPNSGKILNDFNKKYGFQPPIVKADDDNWTDLDIEFELNPAPEFPGTFGNYDDWPTSNTNEMYSKFAGYLLAKNYGGYKPIYSITGTLEDTDIETGVEGKVKPQLEGFDPHNESFKLDDSKQKIILKNAETTFKNGDKTGFDVSDKESNHIYFSESADADVAIVKDKFDYPDMSKQKANNAAACSYYPDGNLNKQNTAGIVMYENRTVFGNKYEGEPYSKDSWLFFEEIFPDTKGNWNFREFVKFEFKKYFGMNHKGQVTKTNINSADFIGKRLSKLFAELKSRLHTIISKYSNATGEDLSKKSGSLDDIKFTHSIGDTLFNYVFKTFLTDTSGQGNEISSVEKPKDDFYFGTMIFNKGVEFPMDFAPGETVKKCTDQPDADKVNNKSILFRHIMPPIFTELDTILDNWSKDFNDVTHSYNADWMKNKTLLSDVLCTPVGLAYCHFIKQAPEDFWNKKINFDNLVDVLKNI
jgi:hypothetical protein